MSPPSATSYDEVPYESNPFSQTHPDRLATVAALLGLRAPPVGRARVLELGCAAGGNLIPLAEQYPGGEFVGVDLSARQVADGQRVIDGLGLGNVRLRHGDLRDLGPDLGTFDYILCHGVYSWVPADVQDRILALCRGQLSPEGIAYVSYNTLPGWHLRGALREMMLYHTRPLTTPGERVAQARAFLDFLGKATPEDAGPMATFVRSERDMLRGHGDSYVLHEHLEEHNEAVYFHQFVERARGHGLRYLGEADLRVMLPSNLPDAAEALERMTDVVRREQYMDFLRNRMFRQTLLVHEGREPDYRLRPERLAGLHVASPVRPPAGAFDLAGPAAVRFTSSDDLSVTSEAPLTKAALLVLSEAWPQAVALERLLSLARARLGREALLSRADAERDRERLAGALLEMHGKASTGLVELWVTPPRLVRHPGPFPTARPLARWQARHAPAATNMRHERVALSDVARRLIGHLDGRTDRADLERALADAVAVGEVRVEKDGASVTDPDQLAPLLGEAVEKQLEVLARASLLIA
jgi:methyltransferase-like protein/SAM-dependent methyltransferase